MNKEKQIKAMRNTLIQISKQPIMIEGLEHWSDTIAEELCEAGYRKASDVAREVFAEIQAEIKAALDSNYKALPQVEMSEELWSCVRGKIDCLRGLDDFIDELKKKWEVEE